ncbi:unnamed protein product [Hymenolepis diminuta]|uniref:Uncharacterized protein n=1 Tax=Hymenolepis diminuta TaxID=6216 RepID=A0A564YIF4_HYMDI|nr:unnamed protein product [Hymenolepis diminuta]
MLKKKQESLMILLEELSKTMNMEADGLLISPFQPSAESLVQEIREFHYAPQADETITNWFERCEDVFRNDPAHITGEKISFYAYDGYKLLNVKGYKVSSILKQRQILLLTKQS